LNLNLAIEGERLDGALELRNNGSSLLRGTLNLPFKMGDPNQFGPDFYDEPVSGTLTVQSLNINQFKGLFEESGLAGTEGVLFIDGALSGDAGNPGMRADMRVEKPVLSGVPLDSLTARLDYHHDRSRVDLNTTVTSLKQRAAEINARVPFYLDLKGFRIVEPRQDDEISIDIESNDFNLAALNDFVNRAEIRNIRGRLNGSLAIGGMIGDLTARGGMSLTGGAIRVVKAGVNFDNIEAAIQFRKDIVQLERFRANSGKGIFNSRGTIALDNLKPGKLNFSMNAKNFRIANTRDYSATVNMEGKVDGTVTQPNVSGSIEFTSGYVYLRNFGEKSIETIRLEDSESSDYSLALYDSLSLSVGVTFDRRFFIRNRRFLDMELELAGNLDLVKNPSESIQMFGTMNTVGGYARPLGKRFDLEQGRLTFIGDPTNPSLNIRTLYLPPQPDVEIRIWYIIEGNVENPKFKYESDPPMELENIISYTLFGQPFYAMDSWKQVVAGSGKGTTAADVAMDVILDKVESLATRKLGIDVVQIDNTRIGGDSGTVIKTGWYINPKVFFAIQNEIAGSTADTGFILEYKLSDRWKLIINQGNDNREGIDLQWKKDY
ncbi:MAG: translocation/assembly module TamB domain-containing protein, partial [Balneolaceae bacterium]|nr:translocation/assembly module TamB domain-containing protein [Balneolaceae bacterium]